jgi:nucleotide-binding universal stress UspA family protein
VAVNLDAERVWELQHESSRARLEGLIENRLAGSVEVSHEVSRGTPHAEIVHLAGKHGADLIVMATQGRGFISHAILGSTTERVIRAAPCPVLAIRSGAEG